MSDPMFSRRALVTGALTATAAAGIAPAFAQTRRGRPASPAPVANGKTTLTPDGALKLLQDGNAAFLRGDNGVPDLSPKRRLELAKYQAPFCAYVSCSDSRVPPELLFGRGLGELFIVRNAGNTVDTVAQGSIEFAVGVLGVPLVVVMGHEACGAVKAAMDVVEKNARFPGAIDNMIEPIIPAVLEARSVAGDRTENAIRQNVRRTVRVMRQESDPLMMKPQQEGKLKIVGAYYELATGRVDFFDLP